MTSHLVRIYRLYREWGFSPLASYYEARRIVLPLPFIACSGVYSPYGAFLPARLP